MQYFATLFMTLDQTTKQELQVEALVEFFHQVSDSDRLWGIALLSHRSPKRVVKTSDLQQWIKTTETIPLWLLEESHKMTGDWLETIALVLPQPSTRDQRSISDWIIFIQSFAPLSEEEKRVQIFTVWEKLNAEERYVFNKLITGGFRTSLSQKVMVTALAQYTGIEENAIAHRLTAQWEPTETTFQKLILEHSSLDDLSKPYPFNLMDDLIDLPEMGEAAEWQAEWKWDGIRGQIIFREEELFVWSGSEELITDKIPEFDILKKILPQGTVIDGEILAFKEDRALPLQELQARLGRKNITKKSLENTPLVFMAFDLLEWQGKDFRSLPLSERRSKLEQLFEQLPLQAVLLLSDVLEGAAWEQLEQHRASSREHFCKGLVLKKKNSLYQEEGNWWKWKAEPLVIDAVLIYAQRGEGNIYNQYTFAVWKEELLVPFTKANSGLTETEIKKINDFVKKNTLERFGPVRSITAKLVFEIAFEGINVSKRHKSGVSLRAPRINHWYPHKGIEEANTLADLYALLPQ